jgi:N-acetylglucosamine transport system substrate-binding protein
VLQGAVVGALLTGCSGEEPQTGPQYTPENPFAVDGGKPLEVVVAEEYGGFAAAQYRKKYAQSVVTVTPTAQLRDLLQSRFAAGSPPDVVLSTGAKALTVSRLVADGHLTDLGPLLDVPSWENQNTPVKDVMLPGLLESGRYDGTTSTASGTPPACSSRKAGTYRAPGPSC